MIPAAIARQVRKRAEGLCEYCRISEIDSPQSFHVVHIVARSHGGTDSLENLALACPLCNWIKGTNLSSIDPDSGLITVLFNPRGQTWTDHFYFDGNRVMGKTAVGRTTVWALEMNDGDRLRIRAAD